ncbi:MAG: hypothetical protein GX220_03275 [Treponema sp.]|nr:hypothetical protein [Treponema sp.]
MKRFFLILVLVAIVCNAFALEATVVSVSGKVEIQDGETWKPLTKGASIKKGAVISTGFKSEAIFKIGNSNVTMKPLSRLTLEQLADLNGNHKSQVYLDCGSIKANVKAAENKKVGFTVKSPVATASVRGTDFDFNGENLTVKNGIVALSAPLPKRIENDITAPANDSDINHEMLSTNGAGNQHFATAGQSISLGQNGIFSNAHANANAAAMANTMTSLSDYESAVNFLEKKPSVSNSFDNSQVNTNKMTGNIHFDFILTGNVIVEGGFGSTYSSSPAPSIK